jgi:predicted dehydrogenase
MGALPADELDGFPVYRDLNEALSRKPVAAIISNPTALHIPVARAAAERGCHLLLEKPIAHNFSGIEELKGAVKKLGVKVLVGFQFRFHPSLWQVRKWIKSGAIGAIASVHVFWGEYLPDWHPWEDYRKAYSARIDLGGGVLLTLCHPFDYVGWLVGEVESVYCQVRQLGKLEIDVEDVALALLSFQSGAIGKIYLDYLNRQPKHSLEIVGNNGRIEWDAADNGARLYLEGPDPQSIFSPPAEFERNSLFLDEMKHFVRCVMEGDQPVCSLEDGISALKIVLAAKQSATERREINVL